LEGQGHTYGIKIYRGAPIISYLLFADDCFIYFRVALVECDHILNALNDYAKASDQVINLQNSKVFFSRNVDQILKQNILSKLGVKEGLLMGVIWGSPLLLGETRSQIPSLLRIGSRTSLTLGRVDI